MPAPRTLVMSVVVAALASVGACATNSGGAGNTPSQSRSASTAGLVDDRPLVTAGARCPGGSCTCRQTDDNGLTVGEVEAADPPAAGTKRFELRTGRGNDDVQITVEHAGTMHKTGESIEPSCGYVDLAPGEYRVRLREKAPSGQVATPRFLIYEHGEHTGSWYGSFAFSCGARATCTRPELEQSMGALKRPRGIFDPCGSVSVSSVRYDAVHDAEDRVTALDLEVTLHVRKFEPRFPRGGACKGPSPVE